MRNKLNIDWSNPDEVNRYHKERARSKKAKATAQTPIDAVIPSTEAPKDIKNYQHDYYEKNKDILKERRKKYYGEHKEDYQRRGKKNSADYYERFKNLPDDDAYKKERKRKIAENAKKYYQNHKEEILEKKRIRDEEIRRKREEALNKEK